jgi:RecB family endonuclease NucS
MATRKRQSPNPTQKLVRGVIRNFINQLNGIEVEPEINSPLEGTEAWYRDKLARELGGEIEVHIGKVGRIDILTETEIIEVKNTKGWKSAIGQIKSYGQYYPKHKMRVHLFGKLTESKLETIQRVCNLEGITLTWE